MLRGMFVLKAAGGFIVFGFILAMYAALWVGPLALLLFLVRRWIHPLVPRVVLAIACSAATTYSFYRMEWFDIWRHGWPSIEYVLEVYAPYTLLFAGTGWLLGSLIAPKEKAARGDVRAGSRLEPGA